MLSAATCQHIVLTRVQEDKHDASARTAFLRGIRPDCASVSFSTHHFDWHLTMVCSVHVPSLMAICGVCFAFSCSDDMHLQPAGGCTAPKTARYFSAELRAFVSLGLRAAGRQIGRTRGHSTANTAQYGYTARRRTTHQPRRVLDKRLLVSR